MTPRHRSFAARAAVLAAALLALIALPAAPLGADPGDEFTVTMQAFRFDPANVNVTTGTTLFFRNAEVFDYPVADGTHRIVASDDSFDSGDIGPGTSWSMDVLEPVSVSFRCVLHPLLMTGSLSVTGPPIEPEPLEVKVSIVEPDPNVPSGWGYDPDPVVVEAGTTVTWRNNGAQEHTVTADDGSFDSGPLASGDTFTFTFEEAAALRYHCDPHPWMEGLVQVSADGGVPPPPPPPTQPNGGGAPPPAEPVQDRTGDGPQTFKVNIVEPSLSDPQSWAFAPKELTARVGDTIEWTNTGSTIHTVTADGFDSGNLDPGGTFTLDLDATGTLAYACTPHPWMVGTIVVRPASAPAPEQPSVGAPPGGPTDPGAPAQPGGEVPGETPADPIASTRQAFAVGTGGFIMLFGLALILPTLIEARRRRRPVTVALPETDQIREPVGAGSR